MSDYDERQKHLRDLDFLLNNKEFVDMSPEAVTNRMHDLGELCDLSQQLQIKGICHFRPDIEARCSRN